MHAKMFALVLGLVSFTASAANRDLPECLDKSRIAIRENNNEEVIRWKTSTPNQYHDRALVTGKLVKVLLDRRSHLQLEIDMGDDNSPSDLSDHIEIIFNKEFDDITNVRAGQDVAACGDYITATEQAGPYKPSPMGAIVHWVHNSNNLNKHAHGFLAIGDQVYGDPND